MKQLFPRGKRIRPTDKDLVFHTALAALFPVFLLVVLLFHIRQIAGINWQEVSLSQIIQDVNIPYLLFSMGVAGLVCLTAVLLFWRYRRDEVKQLIHRQKLARMVLENKWYESEQKKEDAFFKDLSSSRSKETITYFPKIYYRMKQGLLHIRVEIALGKYQEQLLNLEKKLESGLYCELTDKELKDSYVEYTLLYDTIANRISIEDVQAKNGRLRLMENVWWEYDKLPHMLIAGGTGGGKTYFILTLIEALLRTNAVLFVLDPKNADLADLQAVMPDVYYKKEDMLACIDRFYEEMMKRSEDMKLMENYRTGENYAYLGLPAHFLIFDEYVAFMEMLGTKENAAVLNKLKQIVMLGRQAGFFLILACQRPDAKYLGDGIRDQFNFRVALGRMSEMGYGMMFGETTKDFFLKQIKGRGYVDVGTSVISEFYTPLVPKGHDFLKEIKKLIDMKLMENYRTGENYAYLGLPAHFLIFDEYVAFMEMLGTKENAAVLNKLKQIVMLGRQAGFFLILACQRPDAKYLGDGIRDQFNFRVALGRMSEMGYGMMFGETTKDFFLKQIKGRGYVDVGTSVISEFYTPLVPKGHDFLKEIKKLTDSRQGVQAACEAKAAETD